MNVSSQEGVRYLEVVRVVCCTTLRLRSRVHLGCGVYHPLFDWFNEDL